MEVELLEIRDFLTAHPPFALLSETQLDSLLPHMTIRYLRRGNPFPPVEVEMDCLYLLRTGAVELRDEHQVLIDQFTEGEFFSAPCQSLNPERDLLGHAIEDTLLYLVPCPVLATLQQQNPEFALQLSGSVRERLRLALAAVQQQRLGDNRLLETQTAALIRRRPITAPANTSINDAAALMTEERVSALLIVDDNELRGIVTDRDLRVRCLAAGISPARPVAEIMTRQVTTLHGDAVGFEALLVMTRLNVHHLPVVSDGRLLGLVTHSDILHFERSHAVYLAADINRADGVDALAAIAARLPELQRQMTRQGSGGVQIGHVLSAIYDSLTLRLLQLAEAELGEPPVDYAWMVLGSQARREMHAGSDQDSALLLDDRYDPQRHADYFARLSDYVGDGLAACGLGLCPGEVMAKNPQWRKPLNTWLATYRQWFAEPTERATMLACNFFDLRYLGGNLTLFRRLSHVVYAEAAAAPRFLTQLARNALQQRVPLGFFRNLVVRHDEAHEHTLDIKARGLMPIIALARLYCLSTGRRNTNTVNRLRNAHEGGAPLTAVALAELTAGFEFLVSLRARHQADQIEQGRGADNDIDPSALTGIEREQLKQVFRVVQRQQALLAQHFPGSGVG